MVEEKFEKKGAIREKFEAKAIYKEKNKLGLDKEIAA